MCDVLLVAIFCEQVQPQFMQTKLIAVKASNAAANQLSFSINGGS